MAIGICADAVESRVVEADDIPVEAIPLQAKDCAAVTLGAFSEGFDEGFS